LQGLQEFGNHGIIFFRKTFDISKFWQALPKFGEEAVGIVLLQKKDNEKETAPGIYDAAK